MHLNPEATLILLRARVYGEQDVRSLDMALDTGATYVLISMDAAEELGYDPGASERRVLVNTASSVEWAPLITIDRIETMGVGADTVDAVCLDLPAGSGIQGLLGLSFLKHFDLDVHFRQRVLNIR